MCWISKQDKKGVWSLSLKEFLENIQNEGFGFDIYEKGQILMPFLGLAPSKLKQVMCIYRNRLIRRQENRIPEIYRPWKSIVRGK